MRVYLSNRSNFKSASHPTPGGPIREAAYLTGLATVVGSIWFYGSAQAGASVDFMPPQTQATTILRAESLETAPVSPTIVADARIPASSRWPS